MILDITSPGGTGRGLFFVTALVLALGTPLYGQEKKIPKNSVTLDLNPEIVALYFSKIDVDGFGLGLNYERMLNGHFSLAADIRTMYLDLSGMDFHVWEAGLNGRFYPAEWGIFFVNGRLGLLWYRSPYYKGWMLNLGLECGWKFILKSRFVAEPFIGTRASSDDQFIMPFTITDWSALVIPGFIVGVRIGAAF
ncbi:MAG: hypothetical protein LBD31_08875 [Treponema sp.]|jgi:hypothetical protein|nr:hypothetical protein [Treponema sp.]